MQVPCKNEGHCAISVAVVEGSLEGYEHYSLIQTTTLTQLDEESILPRHNSGTPGWADMDAVRKSQQRTYTSATRKKRGPQSTLRKRS
jgi:hypothetical protein